jgi:hypothetical protein
VKEQWAADHHRTNGPVTWNDLVPYLRKVPQCPKGGTYTLGDVGKLPTCSVVGHQIP